MHLVKCAPQIMPLHCIVLCCAVAVILAVDILVDVQYPQDVVLFMFALNLFVYRVLAVYLFIHFHLHFYLYFHFVLIVS